MCCPYLSVVSLVKLKRNLIETSLVSLPFGLFAELDKLEFL